MNYKCPHCGEIVEVPVEYSGKSIKCTSCSEPFACLPTSEKMTSPNASSMDTTDQKVHSQEGAKETKKSSIGLRVIQNMTPKKMAIIVTSVFVLSMMFQGYTCFTRPSGNRDKGQVQREKIDDPARFRKTENNERGSVELFPIEGMKVLENPSSTWTLVGTVRNNTNQPVKGIVRILFFDNAGDVFHKSQTIVAGPKGMTAIQTGEVPVLPMPEWIRPGDYGFFILPDDSIVFEESARIEATFEKLNNH